MLEGVWTGPGNGGVIIAPAHPLMGGTLDHPVCSEIAYACYQEGIAGLRFNWRGVGASQGSVTGDRAAALEDFHAALDHLRESIDGETVAAGYSFGAIIALTAAMRYQQFRRVIAVSPPLALLHSLDLSAVRSPITVICGGADSYSPAAGLQEHLRRWPHIRLHVIASVDHFYNERGLVELSALVRAAVG